MIAKLISHSSPENHHTHLFNKCLPFDGQIYMTFTPRKIPHTGVSARSILILSHQAVMVNGKKQFFAERSADVEASINIADLPAGCWGDWGSDI